MSSSRSQLRIYKRFHLSSSEQPTLLSRDTRLGGNSSKKVIGYLLLFIHFCRIIIATLPSRDTHLEQDFCLRIVFFLSGENFPNLINSKRQTDKSRIKDHILKLLLSFGLFWSPFVSFRLCSSLLVSVRLCSSLFVSFRLFSPLFASFRLF